MQTFTIPPHQGHRKMGPFRRIRTQQEHFPQGCPEKQQQTLPEPRREWWRLQEPHHGQAQQCWALPVTRHRAESSRGTSSLPRHSGQTMSTRQTLIRRVRGQRCLQTQNLLRAGLCLFPGGHSAGAQLSCYCQRE